MTTKKLLSVAEISRQLDVPESTVHYWKNRFAQFLPSVGQNRQKRFRPEAIDVFATIARMLKEGHTSRDVMDHLASTCAINPQPSDYAGADRQAAPAPVVQSPDQAVHMAQAIGLEIGRSISEALRAVATSGSADEGNGRHDPDQTEQDMLMVRTELDRTCSLVESQHEELSDLREENKELRGKLAVMEAELVRLRKDRRELEKYLLDKIRSVTN